MPDGNAKLSSRISLADPYLKTARAKEHLESLRGQLNIFNESKPCKLRARDDLKNQRCRITVEIKDTPDSISLIVGDIFYNLRSALDQLVWCLAKVTMPYPRNTSFPILETIDTRRFKSQTNGVPEGASKIIESLQPYMTGNLETAKSHLLWRLNKLCVIDKHMRIPTHSSVVSFDLPAKIIGSARAENEGVMSIPLSMKPTLKRYVALNPDVSFKVVFGDSYWGIECDLEGIETIYEFVANNVIPRFSRFLK